MKDLTIVGHLQYWAQEKGEKNAFNFLDENIQIVSRISYATLNIKAQQTARRLLNRVQKGARVLILLPMGPEYLELLLGCFYAGVIAVPSYPPKNKKTSIEKTEHIIRNSAPSMIITEKRSLKWFEGECYYDITESIDAMLGSKPDDSIVLPEINFDDIAFLQYSSGSTGNPKGVIVTHRNIIKNLSLIIESFAVREEEKLFSWLPVYHDMGLIGCMLMPICVSVETYLMNPFDFIKRPYLWLEAISTYKATVSGAPNFAFELVTTKVDEERMSKLDLSSWRIAFNGAEPIRKDSVERFIEKFSVCGFKEEAMHPVYGLAESGLFVTGVESNDRPEYFTADISLVEQHKMEIADTGKMSKSIINVGKTWGDTQIRIVTADLQSCAEHEIGEVVIAGESVTQGYWNRGTPDLFIELDGTKYLRTQDMGSIVNGCLYITGRLKEMLIIRGRNYYPQDIEYAIQNNIPELKLDGGAAFLNDKEELVVVQELDTTAYKQLTEDAYKELAQKAVQVVSEDLSLKLADFVLVKPLQIPKTSSGKIRRIHVSELYSVGELSPLFRLKEVGQTVNSMELSHECKELIQWLKNYARTRIDSRLMDERRSISPHIILDFGRKGILGLEVPKSMGGLGFNTAESMTVIQQLASIDVTLASFVGVHVALGTRPILNFGNAFLKNKWLHEIAEGRVLSAFAITENNAGSNPRNMETVAKRNEKGWVLNGSKKWIGTAAWSNVIIVITQTLNDKNQLEGLSAFAVETNQPRLEITEEHLTMGVKAMVQNSISFNDLQLTEDQLIGKVGQGMQIAQDAMNSGRLGIGAMALGAMKRSTQMSISYAGKRNISTGKLIDNPTSNQVVRKQWYSIACSEALLGITAEMIHKRYAMGQNLSIICKVFASEKLSYVLDSTMQLLGGRGYIENNLLPQFFRDGRLLRIFEGPTETLIPFLGADLVNNTAIWRQFFNETEIGNKYLKELEDRIEDLRSASGFSDAATKKIMLNNEIGKLLISTVTKVCITTYQRSSNSYQPALVQEIVEWLELEEKKSLIEWQWSLASSNSIVNMQELRSTLSEEIGQLRSPVQNNFGKADTLVFEDSMPVVTIENTIPEKKNGHKVFTEQKSQNGQQALQLDIVASIAELLAKEVGVNKEEVDPEQTFTSFGIDSIDAVSLIVALEQKYNIVLDPSLFWMHPTIKELSKVLAKKVSSDNKTINSVAI